MGRERANLKGLTCSLTTPLFSQRPERTPGGHAPETRRGLRKDEVNGSTKRRGRHFERRSRRGDLILKRFASESAERIAGNEMALDVERVLDCGMNGQEPLR